MKPVNVTHSEPRTNYLISLGERGYLYKIDPFIITTNNINEAFQTQTLNQIWQTFEQVKGLGFEAKITTLNFYQTELQ